jgi:hypothetical protein
MKFNKADYENWVRRPIWRLEEGIQLLFGLEPIHNIKDVLRNRRERGERGREIITRLDIGERSIKAGTLKVEGGYYPALWACELYPITFLKWVGSNGWEMPEELASILNSTKPVEDKLDTRERTSLLQIIAVLAKEARLDLTKHSKAADTLQAMGAMHGLELPKKKDTIANKLKEARDLQETRLSLLGFWLNPIGPILRHHP